MKCEQEHLCAVYAKHGSTLCNKLFAKCACPEPREIDGKSGMAKGALPREKE